QAEDGIRDDLVTGVKTCALPISARIIRDQKADGIVLKLGINVHGEALLKERTFLDSAHAMLSIIREKHAAAPIVVISPIWSPPSSEERRVGKELGPYS